MHDRLGEKETKGLSAGLTLNSFTHLILGSYFQVTHICTYCIYF